MKINLSKEHIEKGCGLVDPKYGYYYHEEALHLRACMITNPNKPYYRDFLQLVIEAINKKAFNDDSYSIIQDCCEVSIRDVNFFTDLESERVKRYNFSDYSHTEAKALSIAYVFDNIEV